MGRGRGGKRGRGGGGRGGGRGGNKGRGGGGGGGDKPYADNRQSFNDMDKENEKFERYYNTLNLVPEGPEREAFWAALRRELPNAFRFCGSKGHALSVKKNLTDRYFPMIKDIKHNGEPVALPTRIPWYPEGLAYSMTTPKNVVRKYEPFKEFQRFLVSETGVGNISRQEQVSMIPPLLLDVQPHHTVLDLCAAPGSKSAQLIELLHVGEEDRIAKALKGLRSKGDKLSVEASDVQDFGRTTGLLVANDVNYQRAQMLVHQVKRLNSPNLVVTNHDATMFPSIELPTANPKQPKYLKFDRILADVPCSGDGTTRKNPNIWKDWSPQNALGLYITQVRILVRALQMLKSGGRVVYSTCSLNPLENEAVIASAIERCGGAAKVKLIDVSNELPGLNRIQGLTDWSIMARGGQIYESWAEAQQFENAESSRIVPGMFPPEASEQIPLERCVRVNPHQQDTGGFFITVLEKVREIKAKPEPESKCGNRNWSAESQQVEEPEADAPMGAEAKILAELTQGGAKSDGHGGLGLKSVSELREAKSDDPPAAQDEATAIIQGVSADEVMANGKRKADAEPDIEAGAVKRSRTAAGEDDGTAEMKDAPAQEIASLPPSIEQAQAANGSASIGADTQGSATTSEAATPKNVAATPAIRDGVKNAPFENSAPSDLQAPARRRRGDDAQEESFKYLTTTHPELESIYSFYALHELFPRDRFLVRNPAGDPVKGIYYSSELVRDILMANTSRGQGFKFVHAGVKMFMKQDVQGQEGVCRWRIQTEGLPIVEGWVGDKRIVKVWRRSTLRKLLVEMFPRIGGAEGSEGWRELGEIGERVRDLGMGCCVLRVLGRDDVTEAGVPAEEQDEGLEESLVLPLWRSLHSLNLMLPKEERKAMLLRIYNEDAELINNTINKQEFPQRPEGKGSTTDPTAVSTTPAVGEAAREMGPDTKGSWSGAAEAEQVQENIANAPDETPAEAAAKAPLDLAPSNGADPELEAIAVEGAALREQDAWKAKQLELEEDENTKITAAMSERAGEGDVSNKDT